MTITPLTLNEAGNSGFTQKISLTYADVVLLTSGTGASIYPGFNEANTFAAGHYVQDAACVLKTPFSGGVGTLSMTVGDSGSANRFLTTFNLITGTYGGSALTTPYLYTAAGAITVTVTAGTGITGWTAGQVDIYLSIIPLGLLDR